MAKKKFKFPWRPVISLATLILVGYVVYENREGFVETFEILKTEANIFMILLLIPEQIFMYYSCGQIFFTYLETKFRKVFTKKEKLFLRS